MSQFNEKEQDDKLKNESHMPTESTTNREADMHPDLMPPPYVAPPSEETPGAGTSSGPMHVPNTPTQFAAGPTPPSTLSPTNYVHLNKQNSSIDAQFLLDLGVPYVPRESGNWFSEMWKGRAERKEGKRAYGDERRARKEERREQMLRLVGLGGGGAATDAPQTMRTGVGLRDVHPNLFLEGHNVCVSGEVWVLDSGATGETRRAVLKYVNHNAKINAIVHTLSLDAGRRRPHLSMTLHSHNGNANLALPRGFRGQLTLSSDHGRIRFSPGLQSVAATLSETHRTLTCFVGQMPQKWNTLTVQAGSPGEASEGVDEAVVMTRNGTISVRFDDEPPMESVFSEVLGSVKRVVTKKSSKSVGSSD